MNTLTAIFIAASAHFNLPPGLLASVCFVETRHIASVVHYDDGGSNSIGICQIKYKTARWLGFKGTEEDLLDPATNIYYAAAYLHYQQNKYGNSVQAVIAYNYGHAKNLTTTAYQRKVFEVWERK